MKTLCTLLSNITSSPIRETTSRQLRARSGDSPSIRFQFQISRSFGHSIDESRSLFAFSDIIALALSRANTMVVPNAGKGVLSSLLIRSPH